MFRKSHDFSSEEEYETSLLEMGKKGKDRRSSIGWRSFEDERLKKAIELYGTTDWMKISSYIGTGRTRSQCAQRWHRCLDPSISKQKWTPQEIEKLKRIVAEVGENSWSKVANKMQTRCDVQCRYMYKRVSNNKIVRIADPHKDQEQKVIKPPPTPSIFPQGLQLPMNFAQPPNPQPMQPQNSFPNAFLEPFPTFNLQNTMTVECSIPPKAEEKPKQTASRDVTEDKDSNLLLADILFENFENYVYSLTDSFDTMRCDFL